MKSCQLLLLFGWFLIHLCDAVIFPPCIVSYLHGLVDIRGTLLNCSANMPSPNSIPSVYTNASGMYSPTDVSVQIALNELLNVDSTNSKIVLALFFRLTWRDPRWVMPQEFWDGINPQPDGLNIYDYVHNSNELDMWLPNDVIIRETISSNIIAETLFIFPDGNFLWSRNLRIELAESGMTYVNYPKDSQSFQISIAPYSATSNLITLHLLDPAISYVRNPVDGSANVYVSQLWDYDSYSAYETTIMNPSVRNPNRSYSCLIYFLNFHRVSDGIIIRFALPIMIFLIIVGVSFWTEVGNRIDVSLQVLLLAAAMYLVIGTNIPLVGYLSSFDWYITTIFGLLSFAVSIHFMTEVCQRLQFKYPLAQFGLVTIVTICRMCWIPFSVCIFVAYFHMYSDSTFLSIFICSLAGGLFYCITNMHVIQKEFHKATLNLLEKQRNAKLRRKYPDSEEPVVLTKMEQFLLDGVDWINDILITKRGDIGEDDEWKSVTKKEVELNVLEGRRVNPLHEVQEKV
jgi:hypothetical protein